MLPRNRQLPQGLAIAAQSAAFWRRLAPELTISNTPARATAVWNPESIDAARLKLINDGYTKFDATVRADRLAAIARAMHRINSAGLPAAFIGVYDEVWSLVAEMKPALDLFLEKGAALIPNFWAGHPAQTPGLSAQRRRPGKGVFSDGTPGNVTVWMPVTPATPTNGCIYVVPAGQDRNYGRATPAPASAALPGILALPAKPGDVLIWTGETYHWQGRVSRDNADGPLLSLRWEFQSRALPPLDGIVVDEFPNVPFETRLAILARQMPHQLGRRGGSPVWRAVQQTLLNRYPLAQGA